MTAINTGTYELDQMAPHSQAAEAALIGSVLVNSKVFKEVVSFLPSDEFFILRHTWIWEAMERLYERGDMIDSLTVTEELKIKDRLEDIGGYAYLMQLANQTATSVHAETYGEIVARAALRRRMLEAAEKIARLARTEDIDVNEAVDLGQEVYNQKTASRISKPEPTMAEVNEKRRQYQSEISGFNWFLKGLTYTIGKLSIGDYFLIGALSGVGKTRFCTQQSVMLLDLPERFRIFSKMIRDKNPALLSDVYHSDDIKRVLFISTEMYDWQVASVFMEMISKLGYSRKDEKEGLSPELESEVLLMETTLENTPLEIVEAINWTVEQVVKRIHKMPAGFYDLVIVDQLTSMRESSLKTEMRSDQEIARRSQFLKAAAHEAKTVILCPTQFNGENYSGIQGLQNIRGSKAAGDESVGLLSIRKPDKDRTEAGTSVKINIAKIRASSGSSKDLDFKWSDASGTFHDITLQERIRHDH